MLVVTRKPGERILIGEDVVVTVLEVRGNRVRIGIDAPKDTLVLREENADDAKDNTAETSRGEN